MPRSVLLLMQIRGLAAREVLRFPKGAGTAIKQFLSESSQSEYRRTDSQRCTSPYDWPMSVAVGPRLFGVFSTHDQYRTVGFADDAFRD